MDTLFQIRMHAQVHKRGVIDAPASLNNTVLLELRKYWLVLRKSALASKGAIKTDEVLSLADVVSGRDFKYLDQDLANPPQELTDV